MKMRFELINQAGYVEIDSTQLLNCQVMHYPKTHCYLTTKAGNFEIEGNPARRARIMHAIATEADILAENASKPIWEAT